jgi:glycosyltransferase involved in cell wall biosynthesis
MKRVDLIVPAYNEQEVLGVFFDRVLAVLDKLPYQFTVIMVNDGSRDTTLDQLLAARERDPRVEVIDLSRNFGHEAALAAGLRQSTGDAVIVMDADLQDPPELIPQLLERWEEGFDVVNAQRVSRRDDSWFKRWTAKRFYRVVNRLGRLKIPENVGNFRLISARVAALLNSLPERNRVFRVLVPYLGFATSEVPYERPARPAGHTHYSYGRMVGLAVDGITSATIVPLKFAVNVGFVVAGAGFLYLLYVLGLAMFTDQAVQGWPSTVSIILFLGGIQLVFLGVIGEYVGRIFLEIKARPDHVVRERHPARSSSPGRSKSRKSTNLKSK